jgi:hypothetical protein
MKNVRNICFCLLYVFTVSFCGGTSITKSKDVVNSDANSDMALFNDLSDASAADSEVIPEDTLPEEITSNPDIFPESADGVSDTGNSQDVPVPDTPVAQDVIPDNTQKDTAETSADTSKDQGQTDEFIVDTLSDACMYLLNNMCSKFLEACNEEILYGIIPQNWIQACGDFFSKSSGTTQKACDLLDNPSDDPNMQMIQMAGPAMLKGCVDNYKCSLDSMKNTIDVLIPLVTGGGKADTTQIITLIVEMCFPS